MIEIKYSAAPWVFSTFLRNSDSLRSLLSVLPAKQARGKKARETINISSVFMRSIGRRSGFQENTPGRRFRLK
jgi:hypothetical protein